MAPEGVVNALRRIQGAVKRGGALLDLHPTKPFATVEVAGVSLGPLDERDFMRVVAETEAGLAEAVRLGLYAPEAALTFDVVERFDTGRELVETVAEWEGVRVPRRLARKIRAGEPPFDVRERVVLQRLRVV